MHIKKNTFIFCCLEKSKSYNFILIWWKVFLAVLHVHQSIFDILILMWVYFIEETIKSKWPCNIWIFIIYLHNNNSWFITINQTTLSFYLFYFDIFHCLFSNCNYIDTHWYYSSAAYTVNLQKISFKELNVFRNSKYLSTIHRRPIDN